VDVQFHQSAGYPVANLITWERNEPEIGDVHESVVERGKDTGDTENELACKPLDYTTPISYEIKKRTISGQRAERDVLLGGSADLLLGRHCEGGGLGL
jgi:hypothetical protein